jgi:hypothetical protein
MKILFVDEVAIRIMAAQGAVMNHQVPKYVTRTRASLMLGIPEAELNRISKELQRICMVAANQVQGILS